MALTAWVRAAISSLPDSGSRAVRSPSAILRAERAEVRKRWPNRLARARPITDATMTPITPDCNITRFTSPISGRLATTSVRVVPPLTGCPAHSQRTPSEVSST